VDERTVFCHCAIVAAEADVNVPLAEYVALRAEVVSCRTTQGAFVGVGLTAIGVLFTLGLAQDDGRRLLLTVPPLALIVSLLHLAEAYRIHRIGAYIRCHLWPHLQSLTTSTPPSWEAQHASRTWGPAAVVPAIIFDGVVSVLFASAGAAGLVFGEVQRGWERIAGVAAVVATIAAPVVFAWLLKRPDK
jgi:hypothetical protein